MKRKAFFGSMIAGIVGIFGLGGKSVHGAVTNIGIYRTALVNRNDKWFHITFDDIQKGDMVLLLEPVGTEQRDVRFFEADSEPMVLNNGNKAVRVASWDKIDIFQAR